MKFVKKPKFRVVGMEVETSTKNGKNFKDCPAVWMKFMPRINEIKNNSSGVCYALCVMTNETDFRYIVGVDSIDKVPNEMMEIDVPESDYLVVTHKGPVSKIGKTWDKAYKKVLPESGREENKEGICFEYYDHRYKEDETNETDIYIPVI